MTSPADVLRAGGLANAELIAAAAAAERVDLAIAATMVQKESGGRNVWGHDPMDALRIYTPGAPVTREAYLAYRSAQDAGRIGAQGVGPAQLTYPPLQRQADAEGGCWDPAVNLRVGLRHLADLQRSYGMRDGFRRYNGSGSAAESYADDAMVKLARWRERLAGIAASPTPTGDEVDMASLDELRAIVREEVAAGWEHPVPDYYQGPDAQGGYTEFPAFAALGWGATHAARARDAAQDALALLRSRLDAALSAQPAGAALTVDEIRALITEALGTVGPLYLTPATSGGIPT